jgi:hypothetical protein
MSRAHLPLSIFQCHRAGNRISIKKKLPKVNRRLAERMTAEPLTTTGKRKRGKQGDDPGTCLFRSNASSCLMLTHDCPATDGVMADDRFGALFKNVDFEIDEESEAFALRYPNGVRQVEHASSGSDSEQENVISDDSDQERQRRGQSDSEEDLVTSEDEEPVKDLSAEDGGRKSGGDQISARCGEFLPRLSQFIPPQNFSTPYVRT